MKKSTVHFLCLIMAIACGVGMFLLKYHVLEEEKELALLRRQIINDRRELHLLKADWAVLTDPQHLRMLIKDSTLQPLGAKQIVLPEQVEEKPAALVQEKSERDDV